MSKFDTRELRNAFGSFMTGVTVVTAVSEDGIPVGFTANSYTSVSLDPPLLLVCPAKSLSSFDVFNQCSHFVINILSEDQQDISNIFASPVEDRFEQIGWQGNEQGVPVITGSVASFSCRTHQRVDAGDHIILIGEVDDFSTADLAGLGYAKGGYFSLGMERRAAERPNPGQPEKVGAIVERDDHIFMIKTENGWSLPQAESTSETGSLSAIQAFFEQANWSVELGSVFSIFDSGKSGQFSTYYRATSTQAVVSTDGEYVSIAQIGELSFASQPVADMMNRYLLERQTGAFGVYVGGEHAGDVHMLGEAK